MSSAERMNADAANAFLKTLEEPPPQAKIILTSASPGALLPTVLSRCMACACELPSREELEAHFTEADAFTRDLASGAPGRVRRLLDTPCLGGDPARTCPRYRLPRPPRRSCHERAAAGGG